MGIARATGKALYGALFVIVLPLVMLAWASWLEPEFACMPVISSDVIGAGFLAPGGLMMILGMAAIISKGEGLPMNAFPPRKFVDTGIYSMVAHPIYTGFLLMVMGYFIFRGSASGIWYVAPLSTLLVLALYLGYERHDMLRRFGRRRDLPALRLPPESLSAPIAADRLSAYALVFLPWLALYMAAVELIAPAGHTATYLPFEAHMPVLEWTEAFYALAYPYVGLAPLLARRRSDLRRFMISGLWATAIVIPSYFIFPLAAPARPFVPGTWLGELLMMERGMDSPATAFPAFHVIWALLAAALYSRTFPRARALWLLIAIAISASCITTGMHSLLDVIAGAALFFFFDRIEGVWGWLVGRAERIANSWRQWRFGPLRVINHGFYAGAAMFAGALIVSTLVGPSMISGVLIVSSLTLLVAGLWGQALEGGSVLSRPFGFYGGIIGGMAALILIGLSGRDPWPLAAAFSAAGPFIQAIGRLRCLVQGCCHGSVCEGTRGIRFTGSMSRVNFVAGLGGRELYPVQLYSMLWNIAIGVVLIKLWLVGASHALICGSYLILNGAGRFVEESYRGEPQTRIVLGLRLYQWLAIGSVFIGIAATAAKTAKAAPALELGWLSFGVALILSLAVFFAMGVDFPESNRRFSRLT